MTNNKVTRGVIFTASLVVTLVIVGCPKHLSSSPCQMSVECCEAPRNRR